MTTTLFFTQLLNGLQLGVLLFLMAAGLTLVFGIMNFVNLAHGALYMMGAYFAAAAYAHTDSFPLAILCAVAGTALLGWLLEQVALKHLYLRDHLDQVLATFGLILFFNEVVRIIWGPSSVYMKIPDALSTTINIFGFNYSAYRALIILVGALVALGLYLLIQKTRIGMLIRAGASNAGMVSALGVNISLLNSAVFALGIALAGLSGAMAGPLLSVQPGMGDGILILTLVVIIIGGLGSIRGAVFAALIVGVVDTLGRVFLPVIFRGFFERATADGMGPAVASMLIYLLMAVILAVKPNGLFPAQK
jgi:branched-chain amino acid transport system permease protein